ncbi:3-keto-steroid reductase-like isoform X1 [Pomacea canaliculata]|uniref:3-keto-steroid reductase-like isoform X1 n=1 Tax=Pomacea canaliculata TaxID=400727 RepID=UPI000D733EB7|nr:3-keto-steroid reductase-like isoform X1 [Pomacea canaliculata]XP_025094542.1 3-keto-steroid reductase-like isoform X1 [Pomacea canaliculata]
MAPVAVVTGANAGIGLAVCEQLLGIQPTLTLCLACRNEERAKQAKVHLLSLYPAAVIDIVILDTSSINSVLEAAKSLREKYGHINYLYLNAGIMETGGVHWNKIFSEIFSKRCAYALTTGEGLIVQKNSLTKDGLMKVFATNVFGHYVLLKELETCLGFESKTNQGLASQVIWTSSSNAQEQNFSLEDIQHEKGDEPYSSSKYATDMLSFALNQTLNKKGIYSHSTCPGLVVTNMTTGILPAWFWFLILPFILLMRLFIPSMTNSPAKGAKALVWLSQQRPETLDPATKYLSQCTITGKPYVATEKLKVKMDDSLNLLNQLEELRQVSLNRHVDSR